MIKAAILFLLVLGLWAGAVCLLGVLTAYVLAAFGVALTWKVCAAIWFLFGALCGTIGQLGRGSK